MVSILKKLVYKHQGFTKNFETNQPRYTFRLDLEPNIDNLLANFHSTTRGIVSKGYPEYIDIYKGTNENDYNYFYQLMLETAEREKIHQFSLEYYKQFHKILTSKNHSDLYLLRVNIDKLRLFYKDKIKEVEKSILDIQKRPLKNIKKTNK